MCPRDKWLIGKLWWTVDLGRGRKMNEIQAHPRYRELFLSMGRQNKYFPYLCWDQIEPNVMSASPGSQMLSTCLSTTFTYRKWDIKWDKSAQMPVVLSAETIPLTRSQNLKVLRTSKHWNVYNRLCTSLKRKERNKYQHPWTSIKIGSSSIIRLPFPSWGGSPGFVGSYPSPNSNIVGDKCDVSQRSHVTQKWYEYVGDRAILWLLSKTLWYETDFTIAFCPNTRVLFLIYLCDFWIMQAHRTISLPVIQAHCTVL